MSQVPDPATDLRTGPLGTPSLLMQLLWGILIASLNFRGLALIGQHQAPLGPDSSMNAALLALALIVALMVSVRRSPLVYAIVSVATLGFAGWTAFNDLMADPSLWASEGWRTVAVALNGVGVLGSVLGLVNAGLRWRSRP
jgi:hypothetical protein